VPIVSQQGDLELLSLGKMAEVRLESPLYSNPFLARGEDCDRTPTDLLVLHYSEKGEGKQWS